MMDTVACYEKPSSALHTLRWPLAARLGPGIGVACTGIEGDPQALYPQEIVAIRQAVPRRQREFAAGREAARQAMARIGWPPAAIPSLPDRAPLWPEGLVGSISHTRQACVAVVGPRDRLCSIGIDLENDVPMAPTLWDTVCTPDELAWVATQPTPLQGLLVTRLFSAKEAFYKWQYPQTGQMLEFQDVQVALDKQTLGFGVCPATTRRARMPACGGTGQLLVEGGQVLACFAGPIAN